MTRKIVIVAHNIRSSHNVGSLLRTAEGLGIEKVYLTGYTPYPKAPQDKRLPHIADKLDMQIKKTALGAESMIGWEYDENVLQVVDRLESDSYAIAALEQTDSSIFIAEYTAPDKLALILGSEVTGVSVDLLKRANVHLEIPMYGRKESFNVVVAASMALYQLRFS